MHEIKYTEESNKATKTFDKVEDEDGFIVEGPDTAGKMVLLLNRRGHMYEGTANQKQVAARRAKNKKAKASRKRNR